MTSQEQIDKLAKFLLKECRSEIMSQWEAQTPRFEHAVDNAVDTTFMIIQEQDKKLKNIRRLAKRAR